MGSPHSFSRRSFLALNRRSSRGAGFGADQAHSVGLELYSVRDELKQDPAGTVRAVAKIGYQDIEFFAPVLTVDRSSRPRM